MIAQWAGKYKTKKGLTDRQIHKQFYLMYSQTITEVLGEPKAEMEITLEKIRGEL